MCSGSGLPPTEVLDLILTETLPVTWGKRTRVNIDFLLLPRLPCPLLSALHREIRRHMHTRIFPKQTSFWLFPRDRRCVLGSGIRPVSGPWRFQCLPSSCAYSRPGVPASGPGSSVCLPCVDSTPVLVGFPGIILSHCSEHRRRNTYTHKKGGFHHSSLRKQRKVVHAVPCFLGDHSGSTEKVKWH